MGERLIVKKDEKAIEAAFQMGETLFKMQVRDKFSEAELLKRATELLFSKYEGFARELWDGYEDASKNYYSLLKENLPKSSI